MKSKNNKDEIVFKKKGYEICFKTDSPKIAAIRGISSHVAYLSKEDAFLIDAAPDLLNALKLLVETPGCVPSSCSSIEDANTCPRCYALNIIGKAEGRS